MTNLKFHASDGKIFGPFGNARLGKNVDRSDFVGNIDVRCTAGLTLQNLEISPTRNGKYIHNIKTINESPKINTGSTKLIIRSGWIVDSISINGKKTGNSTGGNSSEICLPPGEIITTVRADRVRE